MKQFVIFITLVLISVTSNAQDIITMNKGNRINAIVREITPILIRYNLYDEPNGKVLFVYKDMVSSILYQNGMIERFDTPDTPSTTKQNQRETEQPDLQNQDRVVDDNHNSINQNNDKSMNGNGTIDYEDRKFYKGATQLTEREIELMYRGTPALSVYNQSCKMKKWSTKCIVGGSVLFVMGLSYYVFDMGSIFQPIFNYNDKPFAYAMVLGAGTAIVGGICFYKKADNLRKKSTTVYNQFKGKSHSDYSMNFGLVGNGIGFSISFD